MGFFPPQKNPALCVGRGDFFNARNGDLPAGFGGATLWPKASVCLRVNIYIYI